jgi:creatinine amidohydrolase
MLSDTLQAGAIARRVAEHLGDAVVAPTIPVGCSDHHLAFPGTLSVRRETLEAVYEDYCRSLARHGFTRIACFSGHGGNFAPLADMLPRLRLAAAPAAVAAYTDLLGYVAAWTEQVAASGESIAKVGGHADLPESSAVLALRPDLVHVERAEQGYMGGLRSALPVIFKDGMQALTPNGVLGDPRGLNPELGRRCLEATAALLADYFRSPSNW